jgi:3-oxoacyl-[acyl-carrier protein] reductase
MLGMGRLRAFLSHLLQPEGPKLSVPDPARAGNRPKSCPRLDLSGKVALVTGGSGVLGRVIARTLGTCGADVAVHYFSGRARAEEVRDDLLGLGVRACAVAADVASVDSVAAMREAIARELGPVDVLVTNAVEWNAKKTILDQSIEAFERSHRSCVLQNVIAAKAFVPSMIERHWGRIIGISSEVAMQALPATADYTSGKRGMSGVLRVLAREVGAHEITVNEVAPGWIITDQDREWANQRNPEYEERVPMKRRGFDQDVANAVAFLASDLAAFISGVYLPVCGGNVMPGI